MTEQTHDNYLVEKEPQPEQVQLDETTLYKLKYFNENAINKKTQADQAVSQFTEAVQLAVLKFSEDGKFQVTGVDLDKGLVVRVIK